MTAITRYINLGFFWANTSWRYVMFGWSWFMYI